MRLTSELTFTDSNGTWRVAATHQHHGRTETSLAVLPFTFLSPVEQGDSLSLGFADSLISLLGGLEGFIVPPTSSILKYSSGADAATISRELQVTYVLQGNIQKFGSQWRVSVQLVDAEHRRIVLSDRHDLNLDNVFEIQDEIGRRVASSLEARFRSGRQRFVIATVRIATLMTNTCEVCD